MDLSFQGIISEEFLNHTQKTTSNKELLTYYIDNNNGWNVINQNLIQVDGSSIKSNIVINTVAHELSEQRFIVDLLDRLDSIIDLDFERMDNNNGSMLDIYHVNYSSSFKDNVIGQAIAQSSNEGFWWDVFWKDSEIYSDINSDYHTIIHEIGHALGLSHPFNDPENINWSTEDTVMSYNKGEHDWNTWFSETDINALIKNWGRENDQGFINLSKSSGEYQYKRLGEGKYKIKTEIGLEDITNIETIKFSDKSIDVEDEIITVFNLLNKVDDITGKIYRLYNAAFNRFPDKDGFNYWINKNISGQNSYRQTADSFILSEEFKNLFGTNPNNTLYINALYQNVLERTPDSEGFNYWLNQIEEGRENRSELLMGFAESIENKNLFSIETGIF